MNSNFNEWEMAYYPILLPYYNKFKYLFTEEIPPTLKDFLYYCFINTTKEYNSITSRDDAHITYY